MIKKISISYVTLLTLMITSAYAANVKLAQTGFKYLSVSTDARGGALCDALTTVEMGSNSLFYNPAGMARMDNKIEFTASLNNWIADIKYNSFSLSLIPFKGRYGVLGLSFISVDYGNLQGTMVWENDQGYVDTEIFQPTAFTSGIGYAKALSDKFSIGGQVKYARQNLGKSFVPAGEDSVYIKNNIANAISYDFGTMCKTGYKSLVFGMSVRNFSNEIKFEEEGFQLPLTFRIGLSMNILDIKDISPELMSCLVSIDAVHSRDYPEQIKLGVEYKLLNMFSVRGGYVTPSDEQHYSFGFGVEKYGLGVDYAYTPFGIFKDVQRFTLKYAF